MKQIMKRLLGLSLVFMLLLSNAGYARLLRAEDEDDGVELSWEVVDNDKAADRLNKAEIDEESDKIKGDVRVSIVLDDDSTIEHGYSALGVALNPGAVAYRESLKQKQEDMAEVISAKVLNGEQLDVVWHLTLAANIISANVPYEKIEEIKNLEGVKNVIIETQYEPCETSQEETDDPMMSVASTMTAANYAWAQGYTGAGSVIAIVDTGLDDEHISFNSYAFDMSVQDIRSRTGLDVQLLNQRTVDKFWESLNASQRVQSDGQDAYLNSKVPFAFNYIDSNFDTKHVNDTAGDHGSHVASIAAANRFILVNNEDGGFSMKSALNEVLTQGNAPDAQLLIMKVFGKGGGAYDSDYFAAIEDAVTLGADAVNLSLGSSSAGFSLSQNEDYQAIIDSLADVNIVWTNSAGNNGSWADQTPNGYLYSGDTNLQTGGSPATYATSLSTASVDNAGFTGAYLTYNDEFIFYTEPNEKNAPIKTIAGEHEFIYVDSTGTEAELQQVEDLVQGKIFICNRGGLTFSEKANNGAKAGATAVIIANNAAGTINMSLADYKYQIPVVAITLADGSLIKQLAVRNATDAGLEYYTGTLTVNDSIGVSVSDSEYSVMSDFSSYGVPGSLTLKPEITAPGGDIYAAFGLSKGTSGSLSGGHDKYKSLSGTSMAAPHLAGLVGLMAQFVKANGLDEKAGQLGLTRRALIQSLLMSTATPLIEEGSGSYYSVMKQGSGLADISAAMNSNIVITMDQTLVNGENRKDITDAAKDGKVKAELGDDPERTGLYTVEFTINNITDENLYYDLDAAFFTQDLFEYQGTEYLDTWTASLYPTVNWTVDTQQYQGTAPYDFNDDQDGVYDDKDAVAILDYVVGNRDSIGDLDKADLDDDGAVTTYDAYLALELLNHAITVVPANASVKVRADIDFNNSLVNLEDYDRNGAWIEGYLFANEVESKDGALGTTHSIPVLGYYGSWAEPSMVDRGSLLEYSYKLEDLVPYMSAKSALDQTALSSKAQTFIATHGEFGTNYYLGGNPLDPKLDDQYYPERNAFNSTGAIASVRYSAIRNASGDRLVIKDDGEIVTDKKTVENRYAAYYYASEAKWMNTSVVRNFNEKTKGIAEGSKVEVEYYLAPEYYSDGNEIDWDVVNSAMQLEFVIDNTAPRIETVFGKRLVDGDNNSIVVTVAASDNEYIAGVFVYEEGDKLVGAEGSRKGVKKGERDKGNYVFAVDGSKVNDHLYVEIWDYAANVTTIQINLNEDELEEEQTVALNTHKAKSAVGSSILLSASVSPWGSLNQEVVWTSTNESVATVNDNGLVTGLQEGVSTIRATLATDDTIFDECEVEFVIIHRQLNGVVWDEDGQVYMSTFDTGELPVYEKLSDRLSARVASLSTDGAGNLYGATFDTEGWTSELYLIDQDTFEMQEIGASPVGFMDLCPAPNIGENRLLAAYGPYVMIVDTTTGNYAGYFDLSSYLDGAYIVGIAYAEEYSHPTYGLTDWVFLVDTNGRLYQVGFVAINGKVSRFTPSVMGSLGFTTDVEFFQSLYFDGKDLYWSRYVEENNNVDIIFVDDINNDGSVYSIGSFAEGVWPVGGIYNDEINNLYHIDHSEAVVEVEATYDVELVPLPVQSRTAKGSTNAVKDNIRFDSKAKAEHDDEDIATLEITAAQAQLHNGLYVVTYNTELMSLKSVDSDLKYVAYNDQTAGTVKLGFIDVDGLDEDAVVATIVFDKENDTTTTIELETVELEDKKDVSNEEFEVDTVILVETLTLNKEELELFVEQTETLTVTVLPENAKDKTVSWTSSNEEVATVDENGVVTAIKAGEATITVTTNDASDLSAECKVVVKQLAKTLTLNNEELTLNVNGTETLVATVLPEDTSDKSLTWKSSNEEVATVDENGVVTALAVGEATITVTTNDGSNLSATCVVNVIKLVETLELNEQELELNVNDTFTLEAIINPVDATNKQVEWTSSNEEVATVDENGVVTALSVGEVTITAATKDGSELSASCKIVVSQLVESLQLNKEELKLYLEDQFTLEVTILPENASNKQVEWKSSNEEVATVDENGVVTALAVGEATITVVTLDGSDLSATCVVTVSEAPLLNAPRMINLYNVNNGIDVRFEQVEGASTYVIIRTVKNVDTVVAEVALEDIPVKYGYLNFTDTSVKTEYGKGFAYKVVAKDGDAESEASEQLAIFRLKEPTIVSVEATSATSIKVTWNKEKVHKYVLQYSEDGTTWNTLETTNTSRVISGLKRNTTYYFRVRGVMIQKDGTAHYSQYARVKSCKTAK